MITLLADHNLEGHARLLLGTLQMMGWVELLELRLATFAELGLAQDNSDREVWRRSQELGMLPLTDNRNNEGSDSLEQTLLDEFSPASLPVLTVGSSERLRADRHYRQACAERMVEILVDLDRYMGTPRLYIP